MTSSLRPARTCTIGALLLTTAACYTATQTSWLPAGTLAYGALFIGWCARRLYADHHRTLVRVQRAERAARGGQSQPLPVSCCQFWRHSDGMVHGPDCTRPPDARIDLGDACCERWWTALGTDHDPTCRNQTRSSAA